AITNLVQNSITHNPEGCNIVIETQISEDLSVYYLIVKDDGIGIPEEVISHLALLPYASERINKVKKWNVFGFPIVSRNIETHKITFQIEIITSQQGMKLIITIPLSDNGIEKK